PTFQHFSLLHFVSTYSTSSPFFFFNDTTTTEIYTLSLHDALPIWSKWRPIPFSALPSSSSSTSAAFFFPIGIRTTSSCSLNRATDRKSTRLNSSHVAISYAVFCLKKKNY